MFLISVENINITAFIGVYEIEKVQANAFSIDVQIECDFPASIHSDQLADTIDYATIYEIVVLEMQIPCDLLEKKAYNLVKNLFSRFEKARSIRLKIRKYKPLGMPLCALAALECHIKREDWERFEQF